MRRKIQLALMAGAVAALTAAPAAPASASMICNASDPVVEKVVCGTYYLVGNVLCKVSGGKSCMT